MPLTVFIVVFNILFSFGVVCLPLPDSGPHLSNGWGQTVRLRHLYAAKHGLHLLISGDGKVYGSIEQSSHSLVEIRPVDTGYVAIKGVAASQFLCMEVDGRLFTSRTYREDDCSFREQLLPDGYNIYISEKHGTLISLGPHRQRLQGRDRSLPALAQFLPRMNTLVLGRATTEVPPEKSFTASLDTDTLEAFGRLSQSLLHSPSFSHR